MAFARSTQKSYSTHVKRYLNFCQERSYVPVPATTLTIQRYIAHLAETLAYSSVLKYLNGIRLLHIEANLPNPLDNCFAIDCVLRGVKRQKGAKTVRKLPITPNILMLFSKKLNFQKVDDIMFWGACLVGFFGFLRKSNLFSPSSNGFDHTKHLARSHVLFSSWGITVDVNWSKNNQYKERTVQTPLPQIGGVLCPVAAVRLVLASSHTADKQGPLFVRQDRSGTWKPYLYNSFLKRLKVLLSQVGEDPTLYAGHSLRRGAASWAFKCGVPGETIRQLGDWHSDAYLVYLSIPTSLKQKHLASFASTLSNLP